MPTNKWTEMAFLKYFILLLDSGFSDTQSSPATQTSLATLGSTTTQGSTVTNGSTTTQAPPVMSTPEPPLFQNFSGYHIGVGRADCTGQVADINLVGKSWVPQGERNVITCILHLFLIITSSATASSSHFFIDFPAV